MSAPTVPSVRRRPAGAGDGGGAPNGQSWGRIDWRREGRPLGWWGMVMFIATEAMLFGLLIFVYFFLRAQSPEWPQGDVKEPELFASGIRTILLLSSSIPMVVAERAIKRGNRRRFRASIALTFLLAAVFFVGHIDEAHKMWIAGERPDVNAYTSAFWTVVNFHAFHLLFGMALLVFVGVRGALGHYDEHEHLAVQNTGLYWHFVDVVWIAVYGSLYLSVVWA